jgi:hypothetical protein
MQELAEVRKKKRKPNYDLEKVRKKMNVTCSQSISLWVRGDRFVNFNVDRDAERWTYLFGNLC